MRSSTERLQPLRYVLQSALSSRSSSSKTTRVARQPLPATVFGRRRISSRKHYDNVFDSFRLELLKNPEFDQDDAVSELRWIRDHVHRRRQPIHRDGYIAGDNDEAALREITSLVRRRAEGEPLQYVLGMCLLNFVGQYSTCEWSR
jgi:hypothetical protein